MSGRPTEEEVTALADDLDAVLRVRRTPWPPWGTGVDDPDRLARVVWDSAVATLSGGAERLADLAERLRTRERALLDRAEPLEIEAGALGFLREALQGVPLAGDQPVGGRLAGIDLAAPDWEWAAITDDGGGVTSYRLRPPEDHRNRWVAWASRVPTFLKVRPDQTLSEIVHAVNAALAPAEDAERAAAAQISVVRFRRRVVEQVFLEYEVLGYVGPYDTRATLPVSLTDVQHAFVAAAMTVIEEIEAGRVVTSAGNPRRSFAAAIDEIAPLMGTKPDGTLYGDRALKTIAKDLGAFETREGEVGSPGAETETIYVAFRDRIRKVATSADLSSANPQSVRDEGTAKDAMGAERAQDGPESG